MAAYGRLVASATHTAMAEAISAACDNRATRAARMARGRQFSVERAVDRYLGLLSATGLRVSTPPHLIEQQAEPAAP